VPRQNRRTFLKVSGGVIGGIAAGTTVTAAERTDRFIVDLNGSGNRARSGVEVIHDLSEVGYAVVEGSKSEAERLGSVAPDVEVELDDPQPNEDAPTVGEASPADEPLYGLQWDKQVQDIPEVHERTQGEGTRVSIIDSGVYADHPDLSVDEELSRNFTGDGEGAGVPAGGDHGTHVAGIVAATDNEVGVIGTAPGTDLVDCRVFSYGPGASFGDILAAIVYSANINADAANLSLGAYPIPRQGLGSFYGKVLNRTMTYANRQGTALVVAAGNDSADLQHDGNFISLPNEGAQAISVSATGPVGFGWDATAVGDEEEPPRSPAFYTNYGTNAVSLGAPGGDVSLPVLRQLAENEDDDPDNDEPVPVPWYYDLVLNTAAEVEFEMEDVDGDGDEEPVSYGGAKPTYGWKAGTSMAAPQVAGAAALAESVAPDLNASQVESLLKRTAAVPDGYEKTYYGAGFVDPHEAVERAE
jgi:hypothetical protein